RVGSVFSWTVTAQVAFSDWSSGESGTVLFTSSDGAATLPANATLTNGVGTFSATLKTAGTQTIAATDTVTSSITGTSNSISVGQSGRASVRDKGERRVGAGTVKTATVSGT